MTFEAKGELKETVNIRITSNELLKVIERAWYKKHKSSLDIDVEDGFLLECHWERGHNNDYVCEKIRPATPEEIDQHKFWKKIKDLLED